MTYTPTRFDQREAPISETTVYTVPASAEAILREVVIANHTATDRHIAVSVVPSGDTAGTDNRIIPQSDITADSMFRFEFSTVMETSDFISIIGETANALTVTISGVEIT